MSWGAAYQALLDECKREYEAELADGRALPDAVGLYNRRVFARRAEPVARVVRTRVRPHAERDKAICARYTAGETAAALAEAYHITTGAIKRIVRVSRERGLDVPQKKAARGMHLPHHGTQREYAVHGCRCADCTAANAAACRSYYHRRREEAA